VGDAAEAGRLLVVAPVLGPGADDVVAALRSLGIPCHGEGGLLRPAPEAPARSDAPLSALLEAALRRLGRSAYDVRPPSPDARVDLSDLERRLEDRLRARSGAGRWQAVCDPRACRLAGWLGARAAAVGAEAVFLHLLPDPGQAAEALAREQGLPRVRSMLLWLRHALEAEQSTRRAGRVWLAPETLRRDGPATLATRLAALGLSAPRPLRAAVEALESVRAAADPESPGTKASGAAGATGLPAGPPFGIERWAREAHRDLARVDDSDAARAAVARHGARLRAAVEQADRRVAARAAGRAAWQALSTAVEPPGAAVADAATPTAARSRDVALGRTS